MSTLLPIVVVCTAFVALAALFRYRNRLTVRNKVTALCVGIGLLSIAATGFASFRASHDAIVHEDIERLVAVTASRKQQVEAYFGIIREQMFNFAQNGTIEQATAQFSDAFTRLPDEVKALDGNKTAMRDAVAAYYDNEFQPRLKDAGQPWRGTGTFLPGSEPGMIAQAMYIANHFETGANKKAVGDKLSLLKAAPQCTYNELHERYHPQVRRFLESFGYYDIFLFDTEGNLVYSVFKETDYGTNMLNGPYKSTNFADVVRSALQSNTPGDIFIEDFKPYEPSYGAAASFIASPVFHQGRKVGCAVFQMPVDEINAIMSNNEGLGDTGQSYLIASDKRMRSNSRFLEQDSKGEEISSIFTQVVDTPVADAVIRGETGHLEAPSYRGNRTVSAYAPLDIEGLEWGVISETDSDEIEGATASTRRAILLVGLIASVVVGIAGYVFAVFLTRPIRPIVDRLKAIAGGDLTADPLTSRANDEFGQLSNAADEMSHNLRQLVGEVSAATQDVAAAATEISATSEEMASGMGEQTTQITQVSSAIEEMSSSVIEVARKSADAAASAERSGETAKTGGEVVEQTISGMHNINQAVTESAASVTELGKRGEQIGQIIEVINDIADQTNLLALNAAIEAARAGEHGRGFAVVADEVRKLADRTTKATEEIGESIQAIQSETVQAVERMTAGTEQVNAGVERATAAGESLTEIVESASGVSSMIQSIATAAEQQSAAAEQVVRSVEAIRAVSTQANEGASQAAAAASDLSTKAEQLQVLMSKFRVSSTSHATTASIANIVDGEVSPAEKLKEAARAFKKQSA